MLNKKVASFLILVVFFNSCSSLPDNVASNFKLAATSIKSAVFGFEDYPITRDLVESIPYASMRLKIGKGPAGLMILESQSKDSNTWLSSDEVSITEKNGFIIRTSGLLNNVINLRFIGQKDVPNLLNYRNEKDLKSYLTLHNPEVFELELELNIVNKGVEKVIIVDKEYSLVHFIIGKENKYIRWKANDHFWIDPIDGYVWKSIQNIAPKIPHILIEVTKKPAI